MSYICGRGESLVTVKYHISVVGGMSRDCDMSYNCGWG